MGCAVILLGVMLIVGLGLSWWWLVPLVAFAVVHPWAVNSRRDEDVQRILHGLRPPR